MTRDPGGPDGALLCNAGATMFKLNLRLSDVKTYARR